MFIIQVQCQRGCAELAHTVDLRLLSLKSVLKVIFAQRDPILTTVPNNGERIKRSSIIRLIWIREALTVTVTGVG